MATAERGESDTEYPHSAPTEPSFRRHLLSSFFGVATGRVVLTLGGLLFNAVLARALSEDDLADYFLISSLVLLAAIVGELGLGQGIVRTCAAAIGRGDTAVARGSLETGGKLIASSIAVMSIFFLSPLGATVAKQFVGIGSWDSVALVAVLWFALQSFQVFVSEAFRGLHEINLATLFGGSVRNLILAGLIAPALFLDWDVGLEQVLISIAGVTLVSNAVGLAWLRRKTLRFEPASVVRQRQLLNIGVPLMLNSLSTFAIIRASLWIIDANGSSADVSTYGAVIQLVTLVTTPLLILNAVVPPIIAERFDDERQRPGLERLLRGLTTAAGAPSIVLLLVFAFVGGDLLSLIFGPRFRAGEDALVLLALGQSANVWSGPCGALLKMSGNQWLLFVVNASTGVSAVALALWIVPNYGLAGAAGVTAGSMIFQNLMQVLLARRRTGVLTLIYLTPGPILKNFEELRSIIRVGSRP